MEDMFKISRKKVGLLMENNSLLILFSGKKIQSANGNEYEFEVRRNFYYLTGIDQADTIFVILKKEDKIHEKLFIPKNDSFNEQWIGDNYSKDEIREITGIDDVSYVNEFDEYLSIVADFKYNIYIQTDNIKKEDIQTYQNKFYFDLKQRFPFLNIKDAKELIYSLREVKRGEELDLMRSSSKVVKQAMEEIMFTIKGGVSEIEITALCDYITRKNGCTIPFPTIVAGGKNAYTLHYNKAKNILKDGDLVLIDMGSATNHYVCDVTRTFPVNGKFTLRQKDLYNIVLEANKTIIENVKEGVSINELNDMVIDFYAKELKAIGLIEEKDEVNKYYFHSVSHSIGLNCHDPFDREKPLKEGNVISVEPGLYIKEEGIGIRIEDDVVVSKNSCSVLTMDIIKDIEKIEEFMDNWELK